MNTQNAIDNIENDRFAGDITDEQADAAISQLRCIQCQLQGQNIDENQQWCCLSCQYAKANN